MPIKKSELYSSLWQSCDELRGGMDASQKGYLLDVPKGGSFADMAALNGDKEIGDKLNKISARLAEANDLKGVIDVTDFNDADKLGKGKEMVDRLSNRVSIFGNPALDFRGNRAEGDDILGDASKAFIKDGNKNRLRAQDIHKIVDAFTRLAEIPRYSRMVSVAEISDAKNDFNLNLPRYIDSTEPEDLQDIDGHLRGGIPDRDIDDAVSLKPYWEIFPTVRATLFKKADRPGYGQLRVPIGEVKAAIFGHAEFTAYNESATKLFAKWKAANRPRLRGIAKGGKPKALVEELGEGLLGAFADGSGRSDGLRGSRGLVDPYDVFQHLMDYWAETMQDDCYLIVGDGWRDAARPRLIVEDKNKKTKARPDFVLGKKKYQTELIPPALIVRRWFADEQALIEKLEAGQAALQQQMDDKWLATIATAVQGELDRVSQTLTGRIRQLAERYATPLPQLTDELAGLEAKVSRHLDRMGFKP